MEKLQVTMAGAVLMKRGTSILNLKKEGNWSSP